MSSRRQDDSDSAETMSSSRNTVPDTRRSSWKGPDTHSWKYHSWQHQKQ